MRGREDSTRLGRRTFPRLPVSLWSFLLVLWPIVLAAEGSGKELPIPSGPEPPPVALPHFPRKLDAFVFRNWGVVPLERMALALDVEPERVAALARELGLGDPVGVSPDAWRRSSVTVIRRNWHLLPYPQLLRLLGWSAGQLGYALREDDFLWVKLGNLKPRCEPLRFEDPDPSVRARHAEIRRTVEGALSGTQLRDFVPRFAFLEDLRRTEARSLRWSRVAREGEVDLTSGWGVEIPSAAGETLRRGATDFRRSLRDLFDSEVAEGKGASGAIEVRIEGAPPLPLQQERDSSSHEVVVAPGRVLVRATGEKGVLAAFRAMLSGFQERGGPYLEPGTVKRRSLFDTRYLYSYFALYGDALLEPGLDPYPDAYLEKLAAVGAGGVWMPLLLRNMAPAAEVIGLAPPPSTEAGRIAAAEREARIAALSDLVGRARRQGMDVYVYLNEPRAMPVEFFESHPDLRGVVEGSSATLCTSVPEVREWLTASVAWLCERVPDLAGIFTITASENLTSCYSHGGGAGCPRCKARSGAEVIAEVNRLVHQGILRASLRTGRQPCRLIAWDWGWPDDAIASIVAGLPDGIRLMSVSEWSLPIRRGGIDTTVGEYSISCVGPGPRALRSWDLARERGLGTMAKVQVGNTWEISAVPYIPAVRLPAEHAARLAAASVNGLMLGWTLGGYPSPNLEAVAAYLYAEERPGDPGDRRPDPASVLRRVALRRFGPLLADSAARAWDHMSDAFLEYPYHGGVVYQAPVQMGPANLLHAEPTGYRATMVGIPYDDLEGWRGPYPAETFLQQFDRLSERWGEAFRQFPSFESLEADVRARVLPPHAEAYAAERRVAQTALLHFRSVASQVRFILRRGELGAPGTAGEPGRRDALLAEMDRIARGEEECALEMLRISAVDSRLGFEATNHYYYVPVDLLEKIVCCRWISDHWIPAARSGTP